MSNFLRSLNRKQRRQFDKLGAEEKKEIIAADIAKKINEAAGEKISDAFIQGSIFGNKVLYEHYLTNWDILDDAQKLRVANELADEIKEHYQRALVMFPEDAKPEDTESEEE